MFGKVINGLREVHTNKLLHLDLKPANIYLRVDGTPILLDFGAARQTLKSDLPKLYPMYHRALRRPNCMSRMPIWGRGPISTASARRSLRAWWARHRSRPTSAMRTTRWMCIWPNWKACIRRN
ncbi:hypothetical protein ACFS07_13930 [Undibacterium arcticum]